MIRYMMNICGYACQQLTRLIAQNHEMGRLQPRQRKLAWFKQKYTAKDIHLLAATDERHDSPLRSSSQEAV
jgi:hypothetical protein